MTEHLLCWVLTFPGRDVEPDLELAFLVDAVLALDTLPVATCSTHN